MLWTGAVVGSGTESSGIGNTVLEDPPSRASELGCVDTVSVGPEVAVAAESWGYTEEVTLSATEPAEYWDQSEEYEEKDSSVWIGTVCLSCSKPACQSQHATFKGERVSRTWLTESCSVDMDWYGDSLFSPKTCKQPHCETACASLLTAPTIHLPPPTTQRLPPNTHPTPNT